MTINIETLCSCDVMSSTVMVFDCWPLHVVMNLALARQRKLQITRYFTTQMLHYHKLNPDSKDYKLEQVRGY